MYPLHDNFPQLLERINATSERFAAQVNELQNVMLARGYITPAALEQAQRETSTPKSEA